MMNKLMNFPRNFDISLTNNCNLRCLYCYHFSNEAEKGEDLKVEQWLDFFKVLEKNGTLSVCLAGGEPFIYKDLKRIIDGVVESKMRFSFLTNGTLIDDDIAEYISNTKRCNYIQVSIDGHESDVNDATRGKGVLENAKRGLKILQKYNIPITVRVTINRHNVHYLNEIAKFLFEEIGLSNFSTNSAGYIGLCRENSDSIQLTVEERGIAMQTIVDLNKKYDNRISGAAGPIAEARMWTEMIEAAKEKKEPFRNGGHLTACGCIWSKLAIRADGTIIPCNQLSHIELGHISKDDIKEIWMNHPELKKLRERKEIPLSNFESCRDCPYMNYCTGNCPSVAFNLSGDAYSPNMDSCLKKYLAEGGKMPVL